MISTVDEQSRHVHKSVQRRQDGYKAHIAVEPDTGIVTDCALTQANGAANHEAAIGLQLLDSEDTEVTVLADSAYGTGEFRAALAERGHGDRVKSAPLRPAVPDGFTVDDFQVDRAGGIAVCPAGVSRSISVAGNAVFGVSCHGCELRSRCTTATKGRTLRIKRHDALQRSARLESRNPQWLNEYRQHRPMVERAIAWLTRGNRKLRYRGTARNDQWLHHRVAALNLRRMITMGLTRTADTWALA